MTRRNVPAWLGILGTAALVSGCAIPPDPLSFLTESSSGDAGTTAGTTSTSPPTSTSTPTLPGSSSDPTLSSTSTDGGSTDTGTTSPLSASATSTDGDPTTDEGPSTSTGLECTPDTVECGMSSCCVYLDEVCLAGGCEICDLVADFDALTPVGWLPTGDWGTYTGAPASPTLAAVPFGTVAYGTDGNRTGMNPMDMHTENSQVLTSSITLGDRLRFRSWHVDEGGAGGSPDNKVISLFDGIMNYELVDCFNNVNLQAFCQPNMGPRAADDWDDIVLNTAAYSGQTMQIRIEYSTLTPSGAFEQGWYIDELRVGDQCGPPT